MKSYFYDEDGYLDIARVGVATVAAIVAIFITIALFYEPESTVRPAGTLTSLQLHETTFSRLTTVETSEGWYQVYGAVSASKGDAVTIKTSGDSVSACIESRNGTSCYPVY